jgi:nucleotide-binding universal stress UspA family protein
MYKKILVPLDGSKLAEQILAYTRALAEAYDIPTELLRVSDPDIRPPFFPPLPAREYFKQVSANYFPPSVRLANIEEYGKPAEVIVERAKSDPACLIAMATHGLSGIRRWLLGSVASKVVQTANNPVLLIRPDENRDPASQAQLKTIFVPLDGSSVAEKIFPHVITLAKKMALEVQLLRVYALPLDPYVVGDGLYVGDLPQRREAIRQEVESYLDTKTQELRSEGLREVTSLAIEGDPASEIIDLACRTPNNLIAMSTHGRGGVGRWVLGSVRRRSFTIRETRSSSSARLDRQCAAVLTENMKDAAHDDREAGSGLLRL